MKNRRTLFCLLFVCLLIFLSGCAEPSSPAEESTSPLAPLLEESTGDIRVTYLDGSMQPVEWQLTGTNAEQIRSWMRGLRLTPQTFAKWESPADQDGSSVYCFAFLPAFENQVDYFCGSETFLRVGTDWYAVSNPSEPSALWENDAESGPETSALYTTDYPRVGTLPEGMGVCIDWAYMGETFDETFAETDLTAELEILGLSEVLYDHSDSVTGVSVLAARLLKIYQNRTDTERQEGEIIFLYQFGTPKYTYEGYPLFEPGAKLLLHLKENADHFSIHDGPFGVVRLITYGNATYAVADGLNTHYLQLTLTEEEKKEIYDLLSENPPLRLFSSLYPYEAVVSHLHALCGESN